LQRVPNRVTFFGGSILANKKITVVLPAYNAAHRLKQTVDEISREIVDDIIPTDDASNDATVEMAQNLGIATIRHDRNRGYGGNQKTC
jgi:glycosyltransferase involved in cell wall biosynthesis